MKFLDLAGVEYLVEQLTARLRLARTEYNYTTTSAETVSFTVPAYTTDGKSTLDVYINRLLAIPTVDYTLSGNQVTLTKELDAGQQLTFVVNTIKL